MPNLNKRYCSHCGAPNLPTNQTCSKCGKPISSALRASDGETVIIKKRPVKATRIAYEDDEDFFSGDIVMPSSNDVLIQTPPKLTIGGLRDGVQVPSFTSESLPPGIEVTSRAYFHKEQVN